MQKVVMMGRLTKDPEVRYSNAQEPVAIARFTVAVNRKYKKDGQTVADFFNCVAFKGGAEFIEKYFKKGQQILLGGRFENRNWEDDNKVKHYVTEFMVEEQYFAGGKPEGSNGKSEADDGFYPINENIEDDDLPF